MSTSTSSASSSKVFVLIIHIELAEGKKEEFLQCWQELSDHCKANEPNTLTYEIMWDHEDPMKFVLIER